MLPQAIGLSRHRRSQLGEDAFPFLSRITEIILQNRVEILVFSGACWWFCDEMSKKVLVLSIYIKVVVVEKSAV